MEFVQKFLRKNENANYNFMEARMQFKYMICFPDYVVGVFKHWPSNLFLSIEKWFTESYLPTYITVKLKQHQLSLFSRVLSTLISFLFIHYVFIDRLILFFFFFFFSFTSRSSIIFACCGCFAPVQIGTNTYVHRQQHNNSYRSVPTIWDTSYRYMA